MSDTFICRDGVSRPQTCPPLLASEPQDSSDGHLDSTFQRPRTSAIFTRVLIFY